MTAGRLRYVLAGDKRPKTPAFRLAFEGGAELLAPDAVELELGHLGPEANEVDAAQLAEILAGESRRLHSLLRDQRVIAGIGRAWANEILHAAKLSPYALSRDLVPGQVHDLADAMRDFEEHTIYYCPECQTGGRILKDRRLSRLLR